MKFVLSFKDVELQTHICANSQICTRIDIFLLENVLQTWFRLIDISKDSLK